MFFPLWEESLIDVFDTGLCAQKESIFAQQEGGSLEPRWGNIKILRQNAFRGTHVEAL